MGKKVMIRCEDGTAIHRDLIKKAGIDSNKGTLVVVGWLDVGEVVLHTADSKAEADAYIDALCIPIPLGVVKHDTFITARKRIYASFLKKAHEKEDYNRKACVGVIHTEFFTEYSKQLCENVIDSLMENHYLSDYGMGMKAVPAHPPLRSVNRMIHYLARIWNKGQAPPRDTVLSRILRNDDDWPSYPTQWGEMFITALIDQGFAKLRHESQDVCLKLLITERLKKTDKPVFLAEGEPAYEAATQLRNFIDNIKIE